MEKDVKTPPEQGAAAPKEKKSLARAARHAAGKAGWTGAAVGIGSAAIVAALLYAKKRG